MSWAAHNVEAYDEILKKGIVTRLLKELNVNGFVAVDDDTINMLVESLQQAKDSKPYNALLDWSPKEVSDSEADYFASMADREV
jgi:hypothetical protein